MATKKKATGADGKAAGKVTDAIITGGTPRAAAPVALAPQPANASQRLLREAAWSRMFGRTDAKNPFARSR
jgi:hypothetical protein